MSKTLRNIQWEQFILEHVLRPYGYEIELTERTERLVFSDTDNPQSFNYNYLWEFRRLFPKWYNRVIVRISKIYNCIDFSFFGDDIFGCALKTDLIDMGVKPFRFSYEKGLFIT